MSGGVKSFNQGTPKQTSEFTTTTIKERGSVRLLFSLILKVGIFYKHRMKKSFEVHGGMN